MLFRSLSSDRKTVHLNRPPATTEAVQVFFNQYGILPQDSKFGYHFEEDPTKVEKTQMLVFNRELQDGNPLLEISYVTSNINCRRCHGSKKEYDPKVGVRGDFKRVIDEKKLAQMIEKWELTIKGSNEWQTLIGMSLILMIGAKSADRNQVSSVLSNEFSQMESLIKQLQKRQSNYQLMSVREMLDRISSLQVTQDPQDPRVWRVFVQFETIDGQVGTVDKYFRGGVASDKFLKQSR